MAGTAMKPPPTPISAAITPIRKPSAKGGITLIYSPDTANRVLNGRASISVRLRRAGRGGAVLRERRTMAPMLSNSISEPITPRNPT